MLIVSAIEQLKKSKRQSDEHAILEYLQKKGNSTNQQTLSLSIAPLSKNGIILNKSPEQIAATPTPLENPFTLCESYSIEILYNGTTLCYQKVRGRLSLRKRYTK